MSAVAASQPHLHALWLGVQDRQRASLRAGLVPLHLRVPTPMHVCATVYERLFDEADVVVVEVRHVDALFEHDLEMRVRTDVDVGEDDVCHPRHAEHFAALESTAASTVRMVDRIDSSFLIALAPEAELQQDAVWEVSVADTQVLGQLAHYVDARLTLDPVLVVAIGDGQDPV